MVDGLRPSVPERCRVVRKDIIRDSHPVHYLGGWYHRPRPRTGAMRPAPRAARAAILSTLPPATGWLDLAVRAHTERPHTPLLL